MTTLPPPDSINPKDTIVRACMTWRHDEEIRCSRCDGPALVGWLDRRPYVITCHRCGPPEPKPCTDAVFKKQP